MRIVVFNKKTSKIKEIITSNSNIKETISLLKSKNIMLKNDDYKTFENLSNMGVTDIRAIKPQGEVMTIQEQVDSKIIILEKDEEIRNGQIYKLDKNNQEDLIKLIELGIEKLQDTQKLTINKDGIKYITEKSMEEKLKEGLITQEKYNAYVIQMRQSQYNTELDGKRAELLDSVLANLAENNLMTTEQLEELNALKEKRIEIKEANPKAFVLLNT